jgi:hypothetical protein
MDAEAIRERLASLEKRIAKLGGGDAAHDEAMRAAFPIDPGRSRGNSRVATKRVARAAQRLERTIDRAVVLEPLLKEKASLEKRLMEIESGRYEQRQTHKQTLREAQLSRIRAAKPGQHAITAFGNPVEIKKVNQKSITTISGSRYTFDEIIDIEEQ